LRNKRFVVEVVEVDDVDKEAGPIVSLVKGSVLSSDLQC
jgi:hypothetical protein